MTHGAAFAVAEELSNAFESGSARALKVAIVSERFTVVTTNSGSFDEMRAAFLVDGEPCFVLFRGDDGAWSLYSFVPDNANVREKMLYSTGRGTLVKALGGPEKIKNEVHWSSMEEVAHDDGTQKSERARAAEQQVLMTEVERMKIVADRLEAVEAAGDKLSSVVGLTFPMTSDAQTALTNFQAKSVGVLILAIDGETVALRASAPTAAAAELRPLLPAEPCYCLYRWAHERAGAQTSAIVFLYVCPEDAPVRGKMLHASTKGPFLSSLANAGVDVAKSIEGLEPSEITDAELTAQVYGAEASAASASAAPAVITKAAPRGGARKLVKRTGAARTAEAAPEIS